MFPRIRIPWLRVLALGGVALTVMTSFRLADAGRDVAHRMFLRPLERVVRRLW